MASGGDRWSLHSPGVTFMAPIMPRPGTGGKDRCLVISGDLSYGAQSLNSCQCWRNLV